MDKLKHYWQHKGSCFGKCHSHPDFGYFWVNIPKNASSWTQTFLAHQFLWYEHDFYQDSSLKEKIPIVCLRDPVKRWVSGITEYFYLYYKDTAINLSSINDLTLEILSDRVAFDDHTEKQILFLENIDLSKTKFFWCDEKTYKTNFLKLFQDLGSIPADFVVPDCVEDFAYHYQNTLEKIKIYEHFQLVCESNNRFRDRIMRYYQDDYDLINKINFSQNP